MAQPRVRFSSHEQWKTLQMPYLDIPIARRPREREREREREMWVCLQMDLPDKNNNTHVIYAVHEVSL